MGGRNKSNPFARVVRFSTLSLAYICLETKSMDLKSSVGVEGHHSAERRIPPTQVYTQYLEIEAQIFTSYSLCGTECNM